MWVRSIDVSGGAVRPDGGPRSEFWRVILIEEIPDLPSGNANSSGVTIESERNPKLTGESVDGKLQGKRSGTRAQGRHRKNKLPSGGASLKLESLEERVLLSGRAHGSRPRRIWPTSRTARWPTWAAS